MDATIDAPIPSARPALRRPALPRPATLLAIPLALFLLAFYAYPVGSMLLRSVHGPAGWTLAPLLGLADDVFARVVGITLEISLLVTLLCMLLGFPVAYWLARLPARRANLLLLLVLVPFWTSVLVRSYAWMALLERHGVINNALIALGLLAQPVKLLNTRFAVCIAMVHVLLPFAVLPLYASLRALDWRLVRAAESLGSPPLRTLRQVVLPLARPGLITAFTLVFTLATGFYVTPVLVGASSDVMASVLIADKVSVLDWDSASAMAAVLLAIVLLATAALSRLSRSRI